MKKYLLAIASGAVLVFAFAPFDLGFLAWAAFVPLIFAVKDGGRRGGFVLGFVSGLVFYLGSVYWVINSMHDYGGVPVPVSVLVMVFLAAYLALYTGLFGLSLPIILRRFSPLLQAMMIPALWVTLEYLRSYLLTGFPWVLLGYSQAPYLPLIQIADTTGVWGISFAVMAVNTAIFFNVRYLLMKEDSLPLKESLVAFAILASIASYGVMRMSLLEKETRFWNGMKAAVAQGAIDQGIKWDVRYQQHTVDVYRDLSIKAAKTGAGFLVWPETALPFFFGADPAKDAQVHAISRDTRSFILTGSPTYSYNPGSGSPGLFNSAYLLTPEGVVTGRYDKVHLVPFGEYVPLKKLLPFLHKLTAGVGDFTAGPGAIPIRYNQEGVGVLICFEAIFPEIAREAVKNGATILVNITNDGWFGRSSAPYQHFAMTRFRAVENRSYVIRSANTGISAFVDPAGRVRKKTALFEKDIIVDDVLFRRGELTFYSRFGDMFAYGCFFLTGLLVIRGIKKEF